MLLLGASKSSVVASAADGARRGSAAAHSAASKTPTTTRATPHDGAPVRAFHELNAVLSGRKPGDIVTVTAVRGLPQTPQVVELQVELRAQGEQGSGR